MLICTLCLGRKRELLLRESRPLSAGTIMTICHLLRQSGSYLVSPSGGACRQSPTSAAVVLLSTSALLRPGRLSRATVAILAFITGRRCSILDRQKTLQVTPRFLFLVQEVPRPAVQILASVAERIKNKNEKKEKKKCKRGKPPTSDGTWQA